MNGALMAACCLMLGIFLAGFAQEARADGSLTRSDVFVEGQDGYHTYRIPAVLVTAKGTVLAFAEGRATRSDHAENDIVLKRSTDSGETWGPRQLVAEDGKNCLNNPMVVEVRETGRIIFMYQRYPQGIHEREVTPGHEGDTICRSFVMHSDDDGVTWSKPVDITASVKRPTGATSIASGPGIGIQLRHGAHAGRILIPFNQGPYGDWKVYAAYSDDQGDTWTYGDVAPDASPGHGNEVQFVELTGGRVMLNSRSNAGIKHRKVAVSEDGGKTWSGLLDDPTLIEPQCMGSIVRYSFPAGGESGLLLYSGPNSTEARVKGTIWVSEDDGKTWPVSKCICEGHFAYSCLTVLPDKTVGCLFETGAKGAYEKIVFARMPVEWLR
jgi:sialidase-1